ncbi:MAG: hypothetical protein SGPRY_005570, partial [Prymnesium sp.]
RTVRECLDRLAPSSPDATPSERAQLLEQLQASEARLLALQGEQPPQHRNILHRSAVAPPLLPASPSLQPPSLQPPAHEQMRALAAKDSSDQLVVSGQHLAISPPLSPAVAVQPARRRGRRWLDSIRDALRDEPVERGLAALAPQVNREIRKKRLNQAPFSNRFQGSPLADHAVCVECDKRVQ